MADTEHDENEVTKGAEETAGAEDTAVAEAAADAEDTAVAEAAADAEDAPVAEAAADAAEAPASEAAADVEEPSDAGETAAAEDAPVAEDTAASEHTYEELKGKTVVQMREIAEGLGDHQALHGYTTMHKEELLVALCATLGIQAHEHHEVVGIDKTKVKAKIRSLKQQRDALVEAKDSKQLKLVRARIRRLKRKIHKATV